LAGDPSLDEVIVWPKGEWQKLWREGRRIELWRAVRAFRATLRERAFDVVYDLQGLAKSGFLAWLTGASRRVSLAEGGQRAADGRGGRAGGDKALIG
jgi:heptosyltransferase-1